MKSRTSSSNMAFRKDITRFWPVWAVYLLCHIFMQVILNTESREYWRLSTFCQTTMLTGILNAGFALVAALMLFGDLFNSRMCNGLHSLPLRREAWFAAHLKAGLLFSLVPTALIALFVELAMVPGTIIPDAWQIPLYWWANVNLQYVFFFGLAAFCVMCTGSRFASCAVYGILNSFSLLLWVLVDAFYTPLLHGVVTQSRIFQLLCPPYFLTTLHPLDTTRTRTGQTYLDAYGVEQDEYIGEFMVQWEDWHYAIILAALGVVLLVVARQMYKKRNLETAGDFMAVKWLEAPFQVVFTVLCAAGIQGLFFTFFGFIQSGYTIAVLGLVAGWFAGRMFLERSTRVFKLKNFAGLALLTAVLAGSLFVTKLDPLGIEDWVPGSDGVTSIQMVLSHNTDVITEDPAEIEDFLQLHELALTDKLTAHPDYDDYAYSPVQEDEPLAFISLTYRLKNGWTSQREYYIRPESEAGDIARAYASRLVNVIDRKERVKTPDDLRHHIKTVEDVFVGGQVLAKDLITEDFLLALAEAIIADCEAGTMVQSTVYHPEPVIPAPVPVETEIIMADGSVVYTEAASGEMHALHLDMSGLDFHCYMNVYADCENTLAVLESTGIVDVIRQETMTEVYG